MRRAPIVLDDDALAGARARSEWLGHAHRAVRSQDGGYAQGGHILALFDAGGRMLHAGGDAATLDQMREINFRPGALWSEEAVGTNGPGTALALGRPVHIVGAEHFCEGWQALHCAAVPVRDQVTGDVLGVVDISGSREGAHPHTLALVVAIAVAIEQMLAAREAERRSALLRSFAELGARYPADAIVAVDRSGAVLAATPAAPSALHPRVPLSSPLRAVLASAVASAQSDGARELALPLADGLTTVCHVVFDGLTPVGACLLARHGPARVEELTSRTPADRDALQRQRIVAAVSGARTMRDAARALGMTRSTLYRQLARYGLQPERIVTESAARAGRESAADS
jgi:transcriptional regulator of acetoin/glycerol metabolism